MSLQGRLRLAIGAAVLAAVSISLLVGAYLVRQSLEETAFNGLQRQVALLAHEDLHPAPGQFGRFLATQDERLTVLPKERARLLLPDSPTGRIEINGRKYLYATKASGRSPRSACWRSSTLIRIISRAANSSVSRSRARWPCSRRSCSSTR